ncbi:MAG: hypothetical protein P1V81_08465, partial [Planctomycetota bacterium]|nr:hypothetical protein [Planctomycetota bacterium]
TTGVELLVATGLARLPWTGSFPAEDSLEHAADLMAKLVERALPEGVDDSQDPDVALGVLRAVESLLRGGGGDLATAQRLSGGQLVGPLEKLLRDGGAATSVRVVAAGILPEVAAADGLVLVNELLAAEDAGLTTELRFALLGAVGRFARRGDAGPEVLGPTVDSLVAEFARPEADLRRTALELLAEESLDPFLVGRDLTPFVARLDDEQGPELKDALFALLGRHGTAKTLRRVLALEGLDELIGRDAAGEAAMARLISNLAHGDPLLVLDGARALWDVAVEEGQVSRRTRALALVAELSVEQVGPLEGSAHYVISHWATTLRAQGVDLARAMPGGVEFLERLVEVHVKRMGSNDKYKPGDQALMTALFLSDVAAAKGNGEAQKLKVRVLENFTRAEEGAADHDNPNFRLLVQRSRARFLAGTGDLAALDDFEKLFASNREGLLETVDLRAAGLLAQNRKDAAGDQAAWRYSRALVSHESWHQEPPAVRLEDLRSLASRARTLADLDVLAEASSLFEGLPAEASTAETGTESSAWSGLTGDAASLGELVRLRTELSEATDAVVASEVPDPIPAPEEPVVESTGPPPVGNNG